PNSVPLINALRSNKSISSQSSGSKVSRYSRTKPSRSSDSIAIRCSSFASWSISCSRYSFSPCFTYSSVSAHICSTSSSVTSHDFFTLSPGVFTGQNRLLPVVSLKRPPTKVGGFRHKCQRLKSSLRLKSSQSPYAEAYFKIDETHSSILNMSSFSSFD